MAGDFSEITVKAPAVLLTAAQAQSGPPIAPLTRVMTYSPDEWEAFIYEWVTHCLKPKCVKVMRFSGANDRGIDVAGFADDDHLLGVWYNYQCKHYNKGIAPGTAWPEIGKILWHSFNGYYRPPSAYYFVAPRGAGTSLSQLLANIPLLKSGLIAAWAKSVENEITSTQAVKLEGKFADYVDKFDFTIFKSLAPREVIEQHRSSPYFVPRFGGGLPPRPAPDGAPPEIHEDESEYVTQLLAAYSEHTREQVSDIARLKKWRQLDEHFHRQRECFYHAEALRVFVRDKVEPGTFEGLQDEIHHGVVDSCDATHADGLERVKAVTAIAQGMSLDAHPLGPSAFVKDRRGICHQLANEGRLKWTR